MQYRVYDRQDISFVTGGYVQERQLDFDYLTDNESIIKIVTPSTAMQGDIIVLIETHGAYCIGCITSVDNESRQIKFKDCRELINDKMVNPYLSDIQAMQDGDALSIKYDAVQKIRDMLTQTYINDSDAARRIPMRFETNGTTESVWTDTELLFDFRAYLDEQFTSSNIALNFYIDFDRAADTNPHPRMVVTINANTTAGNLLKDNIYLNRFEFSAETQPENTCCVIFDSATKAVNSIWYLKADNTVTNNAADDIRLLPRKSVSAELDPANEDGVTAEEIAAEKLVGNIYNHYISSKLDKDSNLVSRHDIKIGDGFHIVLSDGREFDSVFTGWKDEGDSYVEMVWGKMRVDYTDRIKLKLRRK